MRLVWGQSFLSQPYTLHIYILYNYIGILSYGDLTPFLGSVWHPNWKVHGTFNVTHLKLVILRTLLVVFTTSQVGDNSSTMLYGAKCTSEKQRKPPQSPGELQPPFVRSPSDPSPSCVEAASTTNARAAACNGNLVNSSLAPATTAETLEQHPSHARDEREDLPSPMNPRIQLLGMHEK